MCYVLKCYRSFYSYADNSNVWDLEPFTASHESVTSCQRATRRQKVKFFVKTEGWIALWYRLIGVFISRTEYSSNARGVSG